MFGISHIDIDVETGHVQPFQDAPVSTFDRVVYRVELAGNPVSRANTLANARKASPADRSTWARQVGTELPQNDPHTLWDWA